jgi:hypothetical protein
MNDGHCYNCGLPSASPRGAHEHRLTRVLRITRSCASGCRGGLHLARRIRRYADFFETDGSLFGPLATPGCRTAIPVPDPGHRHDRVTAA